MDIHIEGNPGTGNTFQHIHINNVETYAPNASTVVNNHYGDRRPSQPAANVAEADRIRCQAEVLQYVGNLRLHVAPGWSNRYESLWRSILAIPRVAAVIYDPGKQKDTPFNRNLVANILCMMCHCGIITETNATALTLALEGDKDHSVRAQLRMEPNDPEIAKEVNALLGR